VRRHRVSSTASTIGALAAIRTAAMRSSSNAG
jgi:hypothetical protein